MHERRTLGVPDLETYQRFAFRLPEGVTRLDMILTYESAGGGRIYPLLLGPAGFRGFTMARPGHGRRVVSLWPSSDGASPASLPGLEEAGDWTLLLDPMGLSTVTTLEVVVEADFGVRAVLSLPAYPADVVTEPQRRLVPRRAARAHAAQRRGRHCGGAGRLGAAAQARLSGADRPLHHQRLARTRP